MSAPNLRMYRDIVTLPNGGRGFLVTAQITDPGSGIQGLPFNEVFVLTIADILDPKADVLARIATPLEIQRAANGTVYIKLDPSYLQTFGVDAFARVANVAEFTQLARDRDTALGRGQTEYLSSSVSFLYTDAVTATAAYKTILDRVSQLVIQWKSYEDQFLPNPPPFQNYALPQVSIGVEAELKAAFVTARTLRQDAEKVRDDAQDVKDKCTASCQCKNIVLQTLVADVSVLNTTLDVVRALTETGSTNVKTFVVGTDPRSLQTLLNQKMSALAAQQILVASCNTVCQQNSQALQAAQVNLVTAQAAEDAALAAVTAVCPTFNPNSL